MEPTGNGGDFSSEPFSANTEETVSSITDSIDNAACNICSPMSIETQEPSDAVGRSRKGSRSRSAVTKSSGHTVTMPLNRGGKSKARKASRSKSRKSRSKSKASRSRSRSKSARSKSRRGRK